MEKKGKFAGLLCLIQFILGLLMSAGVRFVFHACSAMTEDCKPCVDAQNAVVAFGLALAVIAILAFILRDPHTRLGLAIARIPVAAAAMLVPGHLISLCMMPEMRCRSVMYPAVMIFGALVIIVAVIELLVNGIGGRPHRKEV